MVSSNFFNQNSFSRFSDISKKKKKEAKNHFFNARLQYLTILYMIKYKSNRQIRSKSEKIIVKIKKKLYLYKIEVVFGDGLINE